MAKAKPFTIDESQKELQQAILAAAAAQNAERQRRDDCKKRLHEAVKSLAEAQRALSGPETAWTADDWEACADFEKAAAALLKE